MSVPEEDDDDKEEEGGATLIYLLSRRDYLSFCPSSFSPSTAQPHASLIFPNSSSNSSSLPPRNLIKGEPGEAAALPVLNRLTGFGLGSHCHHLSTFTSGQAGKQARAAGIWLLPSLDDLDVWYLRETQEEEKSRGRETNDREKYIHTQIISATLRLCCEYFLGGGFQHTEKVSVRTRGQGKRCARFPTFTRSRLFTLPLPLSLPFYRNLQHCHRRQCVSTRFWVPPFFSFIIFFYPCSPCRRSNARALMTPREGDGARGVRKCQKNGALQK